MSLRRTAAQLAHLVRPVVQPTLGPLCMTCGRVVDEEQIVEGYPGESETCKVLVRHHGAEELRTFDMASKEWDAADLASLMRRAHWFDPLQDGGDAGHGHKKVDWKDIEGD